MAIRPDRMMIDRGAEVVPRQQETFIDPYFTEKVGTTGKTQAQLDAQINAIRTAELTGGTVNQVTGMVEPPAQKIQQAEYVASDGTRFTDQATYLRYQDLLSDRQSAMDINRRNAQSAYDLLRTQFAQYGLGSLVEPLEKYIKDGISPEEFTLRLRNEPAYQQRFSANKARIQKGLTALSEAEYLTLEDQYQNVMRNYGLPASYYSRGELGKQEGFEKLIAGDVSASELEDRIMTAQDRVLKANPEVLNTLKSYYGDVISNGDILAYTLDPEKGLSDIKRKVTAAEIGGAATQYGLGATRTRAEELAAAGVTKAQAQQGFQTVAEVTPRATQLSSIYGMEPYDQMAAEAEVFGLAGAQEATKKRKKLTELEQASFAGQSGAIQGALSRERAGAF